MNIKYKLSVFAASLLLMACTSENELVNPTPDETGQDDAAKREVLLTFKNKLNVASGKTKAEGDPIATAEENYIRSLDIYVFGSKDEINGYTFQELYYYRDDASTVAGDGDWAHSFNLLASAEDNVTTALLKLQKGLFIKLYCVVNRTVLYQTTPEGAVEAYTAFTPLRQDAPGQPVNNVVDGVPTEKDFLKLHTALIDPAAAVPTEDDILQTPLPMTGSHTTPIDLTDFFRLGTYAAEFQADTYGCPFRYREQCGYLQIHGRKHLDGQRTKGDKLLPRQDTGKIGNRPDHLPGTRHNSRQPGRRQRHDNRRFLQLAQPAERSGLSDPEREIYRQQNGNAGRLL